MLAHCSALRASLIVRHVSARYGYWILSWSVPNSAACCIGESALTMLTVRGGDVVSVQLRYDFIIVRCFQCKEEGFDQEFGSEIGSETANGIEQ